MFSFMLLQILYRRVFCKDVANLCTLLFKLRFLQKGLNLDLSYFNFESNCPSLHSSKWHNDSDTELTLNIGHDRLRMRCSCIQTFDSRKASRGVAAQFVSPCSTLRHSQGHLRISGWINLSPVLLTQQNTTVVPLIVTPANRERHRWRLQRSSKTQTVDQCVHNLKRLGVT